YLNRENFTRERFVEISFLNETLRFYRTGDLVMRLADGSFKYFGRNDSQIKLRGYRVELSDIESCLLKYPSIKNCAVILNNSSSQQLIAFYEKENELLIELTKLRHYLKNNLPHYMVPSHFIHVPKLPLTANGKIDLAKLRQVDLFAETSQEETVFSKTQLDVLAIWKVLLGDQSFKLHDNFFDCGGNSLFSIQLVNRIRKAFDISFSVKLLLLNPTLEGIAANIDMQFLEKKVLDIPNVITKMNDAQSSANLFMIHPVGGTVFCYKGIAKNLSSLNFHAVQDPALLFEKTLYNSIQEMALAYVDLIQAVQPQGPYYLGGYSMGGIIANEVAALIVKNGHECKLTLIDSWALSMENQKHKAAFLKNANAYHEALVKNFKDSESQPFWLKLYMHHINLLLHYERKPLCCDTVLFKAIDVNEGLELIDEPANYWVTDGSGELSVINVNASHENILDPMPSATIGKYFEQQFIDKDAEDLLLVNH
ncbi:MAG TPA: thioesterase domain-containing protein, partial [Coxiellaceae bacterium]|nr:thioesterase domain-containing protein [Coxiellaceae bacterium]